MDRGVPDRLRSGLLPGCGSPLAGGGSHPLGWPGPQGQGQPSAVSGRLCLFFSIFSSSLSTNREKEPSSSCATGKCSLPACVAAPKTRPSLTSIGLSRIFPGTISRNREEKMIETRGMNETRDMDVVPLPLEEPVIREATEEETQEHIHNSPAEKRLRWNQCHCSFEV